MASKATILPFPDRESIKSLKDSVHEYLMEPGRCSFDPVTRCWRFRENLQRGCPRLSVAGTMWAAARVAFWVYRGDRFGFDLWDRSLIVVARPCCQLSTCIDPYHHYVVAATSAVIASKAA